MPDSLSRSSCGCPAGLRGDLPASRLMNGRAASDATIPA